VPEFTRTKLSKATPAFVELLRRSTKTVFAEQELSRLFYDQRREGMFARHTTFLELLAFLTAHDHLLTVKLRCKRYQQTITRHSLGNPSPFELACSLRKAGYLSHGSAAGLHGLVKKNATTLYVNVEQSAKPRGAKALTQTAIDQAFSRRQRKSNLTFTYEELTVTVLSGKHTARFGVETTKGPSSELLPATSLERTLVDIAVRPAYAGGVPSVLEAYRNAKDRVSVTAIVRVLETLDYTYPYVQSIGFLMQLAGYPQEQLDALKSQISEFNFYLDYGLKSPRYDGSWRLFYPDELS